LVDAIGIARLGRVSKSPEALTEPSRQVVKEMSYRIRKACSDTGHSSARYGNHPSSHETKALGGNNALYWRLATNCMHAVLMELP
jgi:hypothetical protein